MAWHHVACWAEHGACAACGAAADLQEAPPRRAREAPPDPRRGISWEATGSLLAALGVVPLGLALVPTSLLGQLSAAGVVAVLSVPLALEATAIGLGLTARHRIARSGGNLTGRGLASAGLVVAALNAPILVLVLVLASAGFVFADLNVTLSLFLVLAAATVAASCPTPRAEHRARVEEDLRSLGSTEQARS